MNLEDLELGVEHFDRHPAASPTTLKYIWSLFAIELLRGVNLNQIDDMIAWQYAREMGTPWGDYPELRDRFITTHRFILSQYLSMRGLRLVKSLIDGLEDLSTKYYISTPMDSATYDSVLSALRMLCDQTFADRLTSEIEIHKTVNPHRNRDTMLDNIDGNYGEIELVDRILRGVFNNYTQMAPELHTKRVKHAYGPMRVQVLDDKFPICAKTLCRIYDKQCERLGQLNKLQLGTAIFQNFTQWSSILGVLYRLFVPAETHPHSLDNFYHGCIEHHPLAAEAINWARKYSSASMEDVLDARIPDMCPCVVARPAWQKEYSNSAYAPNSLVEQYLVISYLCQRTSCEAECL